MWKVTDKSTSDLMVDFYKNSLVGKGQLSYSASLRKAKLKMINEGQYAQPFYWSPFILIGKKAKRLSINPCYHFRFYKKNIECHTL